MPIRRYMDIFEKCYEFTLVDEIKACGLYPYFRPLQTRQDKEVMMEGGRKIMLGSNNYLGLTTNPEVIEAGIRALETLGTGCSGSRFMNGTLALHFELENELAEFLNKKCCTTFPSGFQSNLGIISAIAHRGDYVICDKENHASIYDGITLSGAKMVRYFHSDMEDLENKLKYVSTELEGKSGGMLIVTDGVFSMSGDIAKLPEIVALAKKYGARVMVDDAHGFGVLGEGGRGTANYFGIEDDVDIYMGTFSKSLASLGGYMVCNDEKVMEYVKHTSRPFIFAASVPPASTAIALAALRYLKKHPGIVKDLNDLAEYARTLFIKEGLDIISAKTPIVPIYTYTRENTLQKAADIFDAGVYVNPVLPPATAPDKCLLRTSYMATLTKPLIEEAVTVISREMKKQ